MYDERFDVGYVGQKREYLEMVDECPCLCLTSLDFEGEDGASALWEVFVVEGVAWVVGKARVIDFRYFGVTAEVFDDFEGVLYVTLDAEGERLCALEEYPCVERRNGSSGVAQYDGTYACDESSGSCYLGEDGSVV